ncbi:MAG TPA: Ig-like domain-containing protein [Mycobacteriales bacterium]|nr:Ig-like domain-containing protein [Mycobacteriales bacterium]
MPRLTVPRWHPPARRVAFVAFVVAIALVAGLGLTDALVASSSAKPSHLTAVRDLVASVKGDKATISWRRPASGKVATYVVAAHRSDYYDVVAPDFGTMVVKGSATSIVWPDLPLNHPVYFTVLPVGPSTSSATAGPLGPFNATGKVTATNAHCRSGAHGYCVVVDTNTKLNAERRPGAGLLHGTVPAGNRWVPALHLTHWRIEAGNATHYREATAVVPGRNVIEVLSDEWDAATRTSAGYAADPWADWDTYSTFVVGAVQRAERAGQDPIWDIQNEPEYYPYDPAQPPTGARVETEYLKAYSAIKSVDPAARVIGPSIDWNYANVSPPWWVDMKGFVSFAAAHGMHLYAVSWHDNEQRVDSDPLPYAQMPQTLINHAEQVRDLIAREPGIGAPKLFVDENSSAAGQFIPGFTAGYLAAEDEAGVDEANRSCWGYPGTALSACFAPNLGELLNPDGVPNPMYWVMVDYAALSGQRVRSQTSSVDLSSLAVTSASGTTRVLLGRHVTCSQLTTSADYCRGPAALPAAVPTTMKVLLRDGAKSATVRTQRIASSTRDTPRSPATKRTKVRVHHGVATISLPRVGDGDAFFVTVKPDSTAGAAAHSGLRSHHQVPAATGRSRPTRILPLSGANQQAMVLHGFADRLVAMVTDQYGNPIAGRRVIFTVPALFGHFSGGSKTATAVTNRNGVVVSPSVVAGARPGKWAASAGLAGHGSEPGSPVGYFGLGNSLV